MSDARRNSVDIPLSKTLTNLKRVRSLRDPSTISTSKFSTSANYVNWDSVSCNGAVLVSKDAAANENQKSRFYGLQERREKYDDDSESGINSRMDDPNMTSLGTTTKQRAGECKQKPSCTAWIPKPNKHFEDELNSYSEPNLDQPKSMSSNVFMNRNIHTRSRKLHTVVRDSPASRMDSPCMSLSEVQTNRSSNSISLFRNEDGNADSIYSGCGLSSCWSRTPIFKDMNYSSDVEDQEYPLLPAGRKDPTYKEVAKHLDSPRSLSQKYMPKSFNELVGQHVVVQSLMNSISKGRISPIYVFHGPRGTGKTSMARVFAAALNCLSLEEYRPCGFCRECVFLFSGKSRDVKELNGSKINRRDRVKAHLKSASLSPYSSAFKIFIIDECQLLKEEAWLEILSILEKNTRRTIFIMVTSELDKLPHNSAVRCQRYYFPKIKEADIVCRLQRICVEEMLGFDKEALDCIAAKSNGSLRDAEVMLDQLSLLGKRITASLAYELIGIASDDELIELLHLALSSDISNTVRRARELMSSKVDPMQLVSQLANLIMDILSGRCETGGSEAARKFLGSLTLVETSLQKLRHALKILSETEKQLRTTKNQATWLTVALLQFCLEDSSSLTDMENPKALIKSGCLRDDGLCCAVSPKESRRTSCSYNNFKCPEGKCDCSRKLEIIWRGTVDKCKNSSLKKFLLKEGRLSSIYVSQGLAVADIQFPCLEHVTKAEKSWKQIASSLQFLLGCNVELRIGLSYFSKNSRIRKPHFGFLSCSGRRQEMSESERETCTGREGTIHSYFEDHGRYLSPVTQVSDAKLLYSARCPRSPESVSIRDTEVNALCSGTPASTRTSCMTKGCNMVPAFSKDVRKDHQYLGVHESQRSCCFPYALKLRRSTQSLDTCTIHLGGQPNSKSEKSTNKATSEMCFCCGNLHAKSDTPTCSSQDDDLSGSNGKGGAHHCLSRGAPMSSSFSKVWQKMQSHQRSQPAGWLLPCLCRKQMLEPIVAEEHT